MTGRRLCIALVVGLVVSVTSTSIAPGGGGSRSSAKAFVGNFEIGAPGWNQFSGLQFEEDRPLQESFALVDSPVRSGARAARVNVAQGYSLFGYNESTLLEHRSNERPGDDFWYAFSVYFPNDWFPPYKWGIFAQWHAQLGTSPVIGFNARADTATLNFHSGLTDERRNTFQYDIDRPLLSTLSKGRWNDFVMHVEWSLTKGRVEIWHKLAGQRRLKRVVLLDGMPTFQWTSAGKGVGTYLLFGLYRGSYCPQPTQLGCTSSLGTQPTSTLYLDSYARADSFEAVTKAAFPRERMVLCVPTRKSRLVCERANKAAP